MLDDQHAIDDWMTELLPVWRNQLTPIRDVMADVLREVHPTWHGYVVVKLIADGDWRV